MSVDLTLDDRPMTILPFAPAASAPRPRPLQARVVSGVFDGVAMRGFYLTWRDAGPPGRSCSFCPLARCNRMRVPGTGTATCVVILQGEGSDRFAAALDLDV